MRLVIYWFWPSCAASASAILTLTTQKLMLQTSRDFAGFLYDYLCLTERPIKSPNMGKWSHFVVSYSTIAIDKDELCPCRVTSVLYLNLQILEILMSHNNNNNNISLFQTHMF